MSTIVTVRQRCSTQDQAARLYEHLRDYFADRPEIVVKGSYSVCFEEEEPTDEPQGPSEP